MKNKGSEYEKARILKESLRIVDRLGKIDDPEDEIDDVYDLINKAKKIKKSLEWKL